MPSPFPGMNPWLEGDDISRDLAFCFSVRLSGELNSRLPEGYFSRTVQYPWFENSRRTPLEPVAVLHQPPQTEGPVELPINRDLLDAYSLGVEVFRIGEPEHKRVTVLEVISLAAKTGEGPERVLLEQRQRRDLWRNKNRVEIDLWRTGTPLVPVSERLLHQATGWDGPSVSIIRRTRRAVIAVDPIRYDRPLPSIQVPVDRVIGEVTVALQPILDDCYKGGAYDRRVRYTLPPETPLSPELRTWADGILRAKGLLA